MLREIISEQLWIGNAHDARDVKGVLAMGIEVVINLALEEPAISFPRDVVYCRFPLLDGAGNSPAVLRSAVDTTAHAMTAKQRTLVACSAGMSRSPSVVSAAWAKVAGIEMTQALERISSLGPCDVSPSLWKEILDAVEPCSANSRLEFVAAAIKTFQYHKQLADQAIAQVPDEKLHLPLEAKTNSIAVITKHIAGNLISRFTDFLTTDGEKPWRNRDEEFVDSFANRAEVLAYWEQGWTCLWETLNDLTADDLDHTVSIRGEPHSVPLALQRSLGHTCYHVGQIVQVARIHAGENWKTLTIPKGESKQYNAENWGPLGDNR